MDSFVKTMIIGAAITLITFLIEFFALDGSDEKKEFKETKNEPDEYHSPSVFTYYRLLRVTFYSAGVSLLLLIVLELLIFADAGWSFKKLDDNIIYYLAGISLFIPPSVYVNRRTRGEVQGLIGLLIHVALLAGIACIIIGFNGYIYSEDLTGLAILEHLIGYFLCFIVVIVFPIKFRKLYNKLNCNQYVGSLYDTSIRTRIKRGKEELKIKRARKEVEKERQHEEFLETTRRNTRLQKEFEEWAKAHKLPLTWSTYDEFIFLREEKEKLERERKNRRFSGETPETLKEEELRKIIEDREKWERDRKRREEERRLEEERKRNKQNSGHEFSSEEEERAFMLLIEYATSEKALKERFHELVRLYHPDNTGGKTDKLFAEIRIQYNKLMEKAKKP